MQQQQMAEGLDVQRGEAAAGVPQARISVPPRAAPADPPKINHRTKRCRRSRTPRMSV